MNPPDMLGSHRRRPHRSFFPVTSAAAERPRPDSNSACPCGSGKTFGTCCEPLLKEEQSAASAGQLMRSRFSAHAVGDFRHLHRTYWGTARRPYVEGSDEGGGMKWTRLIIHREEAGLKPGTAFVDFSAYYEEAGVEQALHEKSEFAQIDGKWFYTRTVRMGPAPVKSSAPKVGRNEPCPCGSGKKYKYCCGQ